MQYLYYFANTSLVLRVLTYLANHRTIRLKNVTVIYLVDRWVMRIQLKEPLSLRQDLNFVSYLTENGSHFTLTPHLEKAMTQLDKGLSVTDVMNHYHVVVVSHGGLQPGDIKDFRATFVQGLGYCPPSLV